MHSDLPRATDFLRGGIGIQTQIPDQLDPRRTASHCPFMIAGRPGSAVSVVVGVALETDGRGRALFYFVIDHG